MTPISTPLRSVSYGGGVQSTALLVLAAKDRASRAAPHPPARGRGADGVRHGLDRASGSPSPRGRPPNGQWPDWIDPDQIAALISSPPDASWRGKAACLGASTDLFFPESGADAVHAVAQARAICDDCKVRAECLAEELGVPGWVATDHGVYGGTTKDERHRLRGALRARGAL